MSIEDCAEPAHTDGAFEPLASLEVAIDFITLCTAEAYALRADASPNVTRSRVCSESNEGRFAAVVLPYLADAYALARWLTNSHADSQDVVQDACLRALHGIGNFADGDARSWVLTIVRRAAYDWGMNLSQRGSHRLDANKDARMALSDVILSDLDRNGGDRRTG